MTQKECKQNPIMAILNGYQEFRKVGDWREEKDGFSDRGLILELVEIHKSPARFLQASYALLDEEQEQAPLVRGETAWLKVGKEDLVEWV